MMPFSRLTDRDDEMRSQVVALARMAIDAGIPVSVLVNNKAEGCSPLTIRALAEMLGGLPVGQNEDPAREIGAANCDRTPASAGE
jgi:hypothetical protein